MSDPGLHTVPRGDGSSGRPPDAEQSRASDADLSEIDARLRAVERLLKIFAVERYIYLSISIASFIILVAYAVYLFTQSGLQARSSLFVLLFVAPSGALVYVSGAFLRMWTQALQVLGGKDSK